MYFDQPNCTWCPTKGTEANSTGPDQTPQNAASDQGLHLLHTGVSIRNIVKPKKYTWHTLHDKWTRSIYKDGSVCVAFNTFSVISRRSLVARGSPMLTFIVLPHLSIMPKDT